MELENLDSVYLWNSDGSYYFDYDQERREFLIGWHASQPMDREDWEESSYSVSAYDALTELDAATQEWHSVLLQAAYNHPTSDPADVPEAEEIALSEGRWYGPVLDKSGIAYWAGPASEFDLRPALAQVASDEAAENGGPEVEFSPDDFVRVWPQDLPDEVWAEFRDHYDLDPATCGAEFYRHAI